MENARSIEGVNELGRAIFPSLKRRGGRAINKMDPLRNGAAWVVRSAELRRPKHFAEPTTITASRCRARASRPSGALRWLRNFNCRSHPSFSRRGILLASNSFKRHDRAYFVDSRKTRGHRLRLRAIALALRGPRLQLPSSENPTVPDCG